VTRTVVPSAGREHQATVSLVHGAPARKPRSGRWNDPAATLPRERPSMKDPFAVDPNRLTLWLARYGLGESRRRGIRDRRERFSRVTRRFR
jgi:hypothetical protein